MIQTLLVALLLSQADTDPAERLVRAEVLEVAKGDLEKAMAEYRAIESDEKAPASVRARALLALGRCQRKRGELEAARRTFADLLARHPGETETARRAKGFLDEIEKGRPENPDFDWLGDLEKSPEIQARVFELAMQAAGSDQNDAVILAVRQLMALGRAALPVLDKVIEVSADRQHRRRLAAVELHAGRWDRIALAVESGFPAPWALQRFIDSIPRLPEEGRRALLAELDRAREASSTDLGHYVRLWTGDLSRVREAVPALQRNPFPKELALRIAEAGPAGIEALAALVLDPATSKDLARQAFDGIREKQPEAVSDDLWVAYAERGFGGFEDMERDGRFQALERVARGPRAGAVDAYFQGRYIPAQGSSGDSIDQRWARVLRAGKAGYALSFLAAMRDDAIPEYVGFLQNREFDDANSDVRFSRLQMFDPAVARARSPGGPGRHPWTPSDAYTRAMVSLLDHDEPNVVSIALGIISSADPKRIAETVPRIERIARESPVANVRYRAIATLLTLFAEDAERAKAAALIWIAETERPQDSQTATGGPQRHSRAPSTPPTDGATKNVIHSVWQLLAYKAPPYPAIIEAVNERGATKFHEVYIAGWQDFSPLLELLEEVTHPDLMVSILGPVTKAVGRPPASSPEILAFLRRLTGERRAPVDMRHHAWTVAGEPFDWFDWPVFLASDDPLAVRLSTREKVPERLWTFLHSLPEEKRAEVLKAALGSPLDEVRKATVQRFPLDTPDAAEVLRRGLTDRAAAVRQAAREQLVSYTRADAAPIFTGILRHDDKQVRVAVLDALTRFADPSSIEPMVDLLDDPDTEVRSKALEGVKQIQRVLGEKKQWKEWARRVKAGEDPPPHVLEKK